MLDKESFINNLNDILHICVIAVHSEMMKKLIANENNYYIPNSSPSASNISKSMTIRQSIRKRNMIEQDELLNINIHDLFVESFKVIFIILLNPHSRLL